MSLAIDLARLEKDRRRKAELFRAQTDLYWLCDEVLPYRWSPAAHQGLTPKHVELCARMDRLREHPRVGTLAPRKKLKSSVFTIGLVVQEILRDPNKTHAVAHAVEEEAQKIVLEVTDQFKTNERLRSLRPEIMQNPKTKYWWGAGRMSVRRTKFSRQPTLVGVGVGSEITGMHVDTWFLDDPIGRNTIEDSGLPRVASWYQNTVLPVLNNAGKIRLVATRWDTDDLPGALLKSSDWDIVVISGSEIDGKMDYTLENPVFYGPNEGDREWEIEHLKQQQREMKADFAPQIMNDPSPAGEKPWKREKCEHPISTKDASGPGLILILSDPAPALVGSDGPQGEKRRGDGSKNEWGLAVIKVRRRGNRLERILIDGDASKEWSIDAGYDRINRLRRKWTVGKTVPRLLEEATGQAIALYEDSFRKSCRREGLPFHKDALEDTYTGNAKNVYFAALASAAAMDEFQYCPDTCDPEFLRGFLEQAREWRPIGFRNSLKLDDRANVVSFCMDRAVTRLAPIVEAVEEWSPFRSNENDDEAIYRSQYITY